MLPPGTRLGSYEIVQSIAAGGMGVVYKAKHVAFGEQVAIKVLLPNLAIKEKIRHRFLQEAHVQRQLSHANIVQVQDVLEQDGHLAMVMEFIEGPTLAEWIEDNPGPQPESVVLQLMNPIVNAIAHAHARKVVHRDLKPANVILAKGPDGDWIPKLTDFGLVKVLEDSSGMTRTGTLMGTLPFMAPEQFRGLTDIHTGADVFALGMMLRQLVAGALPVNPRDQLAVAEMYAGRTPIPPLPGRLGDVLAAAMRLDPNERLQNAMALERALQGEKVPARSTAMPLADPVPSPKTGGKSMTGWIAGAVVLAAMVVLGKDSDQEPAINLESLEKVDRIHPQEPLQAEIEAREILGLGTFEVYLRGSPQRLLKIGLDLEIDQSNRMAFVERHSLLQEKVLLVLSDYSYSQVEGLDGKLSLQTDLLASLNVMMRREGKVHRVYFTQFIVQ